MKIAILYISKHGTTEKIARQIAVGLSEQESKVIDIKKHPHPDLEQFEFIVLGSSIYAGKIQQRMDSFCQEYSSQLQQKIIGLFICGMQPTEEQREKELIRAFPVELFEKAITKSFLGGEFLFERMSVWERWIVRHISKVSNSVSMINDYAVQQFISKLQSHLFLSSLDNDYLSKAEVETDEDTPIKVYSGEMWECGMVKSLLEDSGIEVFLNNENFGNVAPWIAGATVTVVVPKRYFQQASLVVKQFIRNNEA